MARRNRVDPLVNRSHYHLLTALAQRADVYVPIEPKDEEEEAFDFGELGIHTLDIRGMDERHPLRWIPEGTDAVLLLNPFGSSTDYGPLYFEAAIPVVARFEASWTRARRVVETVVSSVGLAKEGDAVCLTSSWARRWFADCLPGHAHLHNVPAAPAPVPQPMAADAAREAVMRLLDWGEIEGRPLVGLLTTGERRQLASLVELTRLRPDWAFLAVGVGRALSAGQELSNLRGFPAFSGEDLAALPTLFSAMDALCFATDLGTPVALVSEAAAVGTTLIAVGGEEPPEETGGRGLHVPADVDAFGSVNIPVPDLVNAVEAALAGLGAAVGVRVGTPVTRSWSDVAHETLRLVALGSRTSVSVTDGTGYLPPVFTQVLATDSSGLRSAAFDMADGSLRPLGDGLFRALGPRHADVELRLVGERIAQGFE